MTEDQHIARAAAALGDPDVRREVARDAITHGTGIMRDGKRIDPAEFFAQPAVDPLREASDVTAREAVERLVTVARRQVESMCEGFCKNLPSAGFFTEDMEHDCAVCRMRAALAAAPQAATVDPLREALLDDDSLSAQIGDLGNQIHNLGCTYQNEEDLSERLEELRSTAWKLARRADALIAAGLRLPGAVKPDEALAWAVIGENGVIDPEAIAPDLFSAELLGVRPGERLIRVAIRIVEDEA